MTTNEEQQVQAAEDRTIGERMAAVEGKMDVLLDVVHENGRRSDQNYRALDAKLDAQDAKFDAKIDRLMYFMLGIGGAVLVGIIVGVVSIVLQLAL
ncbi:MAG: hypothetical protein OXI16_13705 [Chloroflexota bacterium]|nr:hypothetical protein [Chloroflexota bacterium]